MTTPLTPMQAEAMIAEAVRLTRHSNLAVGDTVIVSLTICSTICKIAAIDHATGFARLQPRPPSPETIRVPIISLAHETAMEAVANRRGIVAAVTLYTAPQERPPMTEPIDYRTAPPFDPDAAFLARPVSSGTAARMTDLRRAYAAHAQDMALLIPASYELDRAFVALRSSFQWAIAALEATDPGGSGGQQPSPWSNDARDPS